MREADSVCNECVFACMQNYHAYAAYVMRLARPCTISFTLRFSVVFSPIFLPFRNSNSSRRSCCSPVLQIAQNEFKMQQHVVIVVCVCGLLSVVHNKCECNWNFKYSVYEIEARNNAQTILTIFLCVEKSQLNINNFI